MVLPEAVLVKTIGRAEDSVVLTLSELLMLFLMLKLPLLIDAVDATDE